jgi:hypothetical protein
MAESVAFKPTQRNSDHIAMAPRTSEPLANTPLSRPRSEGASRCPSQVLVRDGATRLTGSAVLAGGRAHHGRQRLRPSAAWMGAAPVPARPATVPLLPKPVSEQIQRCGGVQCLPGTCDHDQGEMAHRSSDGTPGPAKIPPMVAKVLGTPGRALDASTRSGLEERLGHDFGQVRIHTDAEAAQSAHAIHARAYTFGRHVVMGQDRYQPHTEAGMQLLAHELTHVVQQGNPVGDTGPARAISRHDDPSEREADHVVGMLNRSPGMHASPGLLQRQDDDGVPIGDGDGPTPSGAVQTQGQGDGLTQPAACSAAKDDCNAQCPGARPGKCSCWKGGTLNYTCVVQCNCPPLTS